MARERFSPKRLIGFGIAVLVFIIATRVMGIRLTSFFHCRAAFVVLGISFGLLLALSEGAFLNLIKSCIMSCFLDPAAGDPQVEGLARTGKWCFLASGVFATLIGLVQILTNLLDCTNVGEGIAFVLCSVFYAVIGALFFLIAECSHRPRADRSEIPKSIG